ncbi:hypothetical protein GCM10022289_10070 [Pedobacter jeongneungensis]|uniref:Aspartyl protease n=1 Tax=Pedobacter jeongneungensis TaxID=947309 RepID=A0ABP8B7A3_9SPHI
MEKIKLKRLYVTVEFAGLNAEYGLKAGQRYQMTIAYLIDLGSTQSILENVEDYLFFINYSFARGFDRDWKSLLSCRDLNLMTYLIG